MVVKEILGAHRIEIETGGFVSFDTQLTNSPHKHDYYEICLALLGSGEYWHGGKSFQIRPGTIFLAEPGVVHEIASFKTKDLRLYFVTMTLSRLDGPLGREADPILGSFESSHQIASTDHQTLANYVPLIDNAAAWRQCSAEVALRQFALEMIHALCPKSDSSAGQVREDDLTLALTLIEQNSDQRLTVEGIAKELGISSRTLRRRFESTGTTIVDEINHRRMRRAAHRLLMGFTVQEVADFVGINSAAQFTRSFTRVFGIGPKKFQTSYLPGALAHRTRPEWDTLD